MIPLCWLEQWLNTVYVQQSLSKHLTVSGKVLMKFSLKQAAGKALSDQNDDDFLRIESYSTFQTRCCLLNSMNCIIIIVIIILTAIQNTPHTV